MEQAAHLWGSGGAGAARCGGDHAHIGVHAPFPLILVNAITLYFGQVEEVLHGPQVYEQRLGGSPGVFLLTQNL